MLLNESEKVEEIVDKATKKYKCVTSAIQHEDKNRDLYYLAGKQRTSQAT